MVQAHRSGRVLVGTASWTDPSLVKSGRFYPKGCNSAEAMLRFYAENFPMVEVDSSYYALPRSDWAEKWVQRTPSDFRFNIKAFRLFTGHWTPEKVLPDDVKRELASFFASGRNLTYKDTPAEIRDLLWQRYERAIRPLKESGKLGAVHFQFAPTVRFSTKAIDHVLECATRLAGYHLAIEFRQQSWFEGENRKDTLAFERKYDLTHVIVDEPQGFTNSIPSVWEVTSPKLAIVRMHGRNAETWNARGEVASDRFNYDYSDTELAEMATPIRKIASQVDEVDVVFNNNYEDQAQRNGKTLMGLVSNQVDA